MLQDATYKWHVVVIDPHKESVVTAEALLPIAQFLLYMLRSVGATETPIGPLQEGATEVLGTAETMSTLFGEGHSNDEGDDSNLLDTISHEITTPVRFLKQWSADESCPSSAANVPATMTHPSPSKTFAYCVNALVAPALRYSPNYSFSRRNRLLHAHLTHRKVVSITCVTGCKQR